LGRIFQEAFLPVKQSWQLAWRSPEFRKKIISGLVIITGILAVFPLFFQFIEKRNGLNLNDWLLKYLPVRDVSKAIFIIIWSTSILVLFRCLRNPQMFLLFLWGYILLSLTRMVSITVFALDPPQNLLPLVDPISNTFYGESYVTKDLFFSGHTATVFLMFLCLERPADKIIGLAASVAVGTLLLVQHVHYTIDVLAAPLFTYLVYLASRKIAGN